MGQLESLEVSSRLLVHYKLSVRNSWCSALVDSPLPITSVRPLTSHQGGVIFTINFLIAFCWEQGEAPFVQNLINIMLEWKNKVNNFFIFLHLIYRLLYWFLFLFLFLQKRDILSTFKSAPVKASTLWPNYRTVYLFFPLPPSSFSDSIVSFSTSRKLFLWITVYKHYSFYLHDI